MKKIEVEGGEFMIQSKEGHYAIIPAKDRKKVMKLVKDGCDDCINSYIKTLPRDSDYARDGLLSRASRAIKTFVSTKNIDAAVSASKPIKEIDPDEKVYVTKNTKPIKQKTDKTTSFFNDIGVYQPGQEEQLFTEIKDDEIQSRSERYEPNINLAAGSNKAQAIIKRNENYVSKYYGNKNPEVKQDVIQIQEKLGSLYTGEIDGVFGKKTLEALETKTKIELLDDSLVKKYYKNYKLNNYDKTVVVEVQKLLQQNGLLSEKDIDGKFGDVTKNAFYKLKANNTSSKFDWLKDIKSIDDERCAAGMCKLYDKSGIRSNSLGMKSVDAWDMFSKMTKAGGIPVYNIYEEPEFKGIKTVKELKSATINVKKRSKVTADMFKVGDVVGIFYPMSTYHEETLGSKTHNTHVGFVSRIENGIPIITHNIKGEIYHQPYTSLNTTWINRPKITAENNKFQNPSLISVSSDFVNERVDNIQEKLETNFSEERRNVVFKIIQQSYNDSSHMAKELDSDIDTDWLSKAVIGITGVETGVGVNAKRERSDISLLRKTAYIAANKKDSEISLGIGKMKLNALDDFGKSYTGIKTAEDFKDDSKAIRGVMYKLIKNYELMKDFRDKNPELGLTEEDIKNLTLLGYNRGMNRILKIGKLSDTKNFKEELQTFRNLYKGNSYDPSETTFNYIPVIGKFLYGINNPEGTETYISKVNRYIDVL